MLPAQHLSCEAARRRGSPPVPEPDQGDDSGRKDQAAGSRQAMAAAYGINLA
jgi:hypothetical protein